MAWCRDRRAVSMEHGALRMSRSAVLFVLVVALLQVAGAGEARASQGRPNEAVAQHAIGQLRSPYCPGLMLEVCPSPQAAALRDSIYGLAAEGATSNEIVDWMLARHGQEWRGVPLRSGAGLWAWIVPPLALLFGVGAVVGWLRAHRTPAEGPDLVAEESVSDADRDRIAAALREWEESGEEEI